MDALSDDEHRAFAEALLSFGGMASETRDFARSLSRGEMAVDMPSSDNEFASPLKALHATLKHLTWQTKQVASGDYEQRVRFMGEFSASFNEMIGQLSARQREIEEENERRQKQLDELGRANSIFESIMGNMPEWIVMVNRVTGEYIFSNHAVESMLASDTFEQQLYGTLFECAASMSNDDKPRKEAFALISDIAVQYFEMMLYPLRWFEHEAAICVLTDVTATKEEHNRLEDIAYRDVMTGVYNRLYGMKTLEQWALEKKQFSLAFIDMDMLKYVNDEFGHNEGDAYIKSVANILGEVGGAPTVCRLGGDEFMVLLEEHDCQGRDLEAVFEALREKLKNSPVLNEAGEPLYTPSISFGIVSVEGNEARPTGELLAIADERMYEYKKAHKKERRT